jgi:hypothetical protein
MDITIEIRVPFETMSAFKEGEAKGGFKGKIKRIM